MMNEELGGRWRWDVKCMGGIETGTCICMYLKNSAN